MRKSRVKSKLANGEAVLVTTCHFTDPSLFELVSLLGFDCVWMDMEHHTYSLETAAELMRAARVGSADIIARPAKGEFMRMQRMLEAGAQGIMYPRCDDAAEATEVVKWAKFPPSGVRGVDGGNPDMPYLSMTLPDYIQRANEETFVAIQIEQKETVDHIEAIAAVEGVDILMIGPGDLSIRLGVPGETMHDKVMTVVKRVAKAAEESGKAWGLPVGSVDAAKQMMDLGAQWICFGGDIVFLKTAFEKVQADFAPLGFTFDNRLSAQASSSASQYEK